MVEPLGESWGEGRRREGEREGRREGERKKRETLLASTVQVLLYKRCYLSLV